MATLNVIIAERRKYVVALHKLWRNVDTIGERVQRHFNNLRKRTKKVPEEEDLKDLAEDLRDMLRAQNTFRIMLDRGYPL